MSSRNRSPQKLRPADDQPISVGAAGFRPDSPLVVAQETITFTLDEPGPVTVAPTSGLFDPDIASFTLNRQGDFLKLTVAKQSGDKEVDYTLTVSGGVRHLGNVGSTGTIRVGGTHF